MLRSKQSPIARKFSGGDAFRFVLSVTATQLQRFSIVGALAVGCHLVGARARMTHKLTASAWVAPRSKKRAETRKFKKTSKRCRDGRMDGDVGMGGWMEALADKVHKQAEHIATFHTTIPT